MRQCHCRVVLLGAALAVSGCMVGPDYHQPRAPLSIRYKELAGWTPAQPGDMASKGEWWTIYRDPLLDKLESRVEISNQTSSAGVPAAICALIRSPTIRAQSEISPSTITTSAP